MTLLLVEQLEAEVTHWLRSRHNVRCEPALAGDPAAFRTALRGVRGLIVPPSVALDKQALRQAPQLRAVGCVSAGTDHVDVEACERAGVQVLRSRSATAPAEAEFIITALLSLLRRVPVADADGMWVGRELQGSCVGLIGMAPVARRVATLLTAFGAQVQGYDPSLHASNPLWQTWGVKPVGLRELLQTSEAVSVQLNAFSRYRGLLGERYLPFCKQDQVIVSIANSSLFDEAALADALRSQRIAAAWLDSVPPGALDAGRPLAGIGTLQVTPRVASTTRESRLRSAWSVAKRLDKVLSVEEPSADTMTPMARLFARIHAHAVVVSPIS